MNLSTIFFLLTILIHASDCINCYICGQQGDNSMQIGFETNSESQCKMHTLVACNENSICQTMILNKNGQKSILKGCLDELPWTGGASVELNHGFCRQSVYIVDAMQCVCTHDKCNHDSFIHQFNSFTFISKIHS